MSVSLDDYSDNVISKGFSDIELDKSDYQRVRNGKLEQVHDSRKRSYEDDMNELEKDVIRHIHTLNMMAISSIASESTIKERLRKLLHNIGTHFGLNQEGK